MCTVSYKSYLGCAQLIKLEVRNISASYDGALVLKDLSFTIEGPGLMQVLGPNGAGKTTLFRVILGLLKPVKGRILVNGEDVTGKPEKAGRFIGYVPQLTGIYEHEFPLTVWEFVESSLLLNKKWPRLLPSREDIEKVKRVLSIVGIREELWGRSLWRLSGGEKQRVLIAKALISNPKILILDEPFSSVDPHGRLELAKVVTELAKSRLVLISCHDPIPLLANTKAILLLNKHLYIFGRPNEVLTIENARKIYGDAAMLIEGKYLHICDSHAWR